MMYSHLEFTLELETGDSHCPFFWEEPEMTNISTLMTTDVISFRKETAITDALRTLIDHRISGAPVVDHENRIVGVVSEVDLLSLFWETNASVVGDVMTKSPVCCPVNGPLIDVVDCLMGNNFRRVLIHDGAGKLAGLVSRADLMPTLLDELLRRRSD